MTLYLSNRDGNGKTSEEGHYKFPTSVFTGNVLGSTALLVTQNTPLGMSVLVSPGQFKIDTVDYSYTGWNTSSEPVIVSTADPANMRITSIVAYVDKQASTSPSPPNNPGIVKLKAVNGTPAASPSAPTSTTIQSSVGAGNPYIVLANINVPAGASNITNINIIDQRVQVVVGSNLVGPNSLIDSAVTTAKIANLAVTGAKIAENTIPGSKLTAASVPIDKITNPYRFNVWRSGAFSTVGGVIVYENKHFDTNNNYNTANGRYTAPINGFYVFIVNSNQSVNSAPNDPQMYIRKNGNQAIAGSHFVNMYNGASSGSANASAFVQMNAGDYIEVINGNRPLVTGFGENNFAGFCVTPV